MSWNLDGLGRIAFIIAAASVLKGKPILNHAGQKTAAGWI